MHANQRRFQCESPKKKKAALRQRNEALGPPINKEERIERGRWFQSAGTAGPIKAKVRVLATVVLPVK
jgi:hypothetical protein